MISIIVCSRKPDVSEELRKNTASTIGCDYEWVVIDNSHNQYGICQAYNLGVERARGDVLCFMHDDVLFHTVNWGQIVEKAFEDDASIGAIGIAGAHVVADAPAPMWSLQHLSTFKLFSADPDCSSYALHSGENPNGGYWYGNQLYAEGKDEVEVANIDGVWMCIRASLFDTICFDEANFNGFHCYDADISMQINQANYRILVTNRILIEHLSPGTLTEAYFKTAECWYAKWKPFLPVARGVELSPRQMEVVHRNTLDAIERQKEQEEYRRIKLTRAYRLGSFLLRPLRALRSLFSPNSEMVS